jgi:shikimate kinase
MDREIEERVGPLVPVFTERGEQAFREEEHLLLEELLDQQDMIIATGGGAPIERDHMPRMNTHGTTVFIDVPDDVLAQRIIQKGKDRPMFFGRSDADIRSMIAELRPRRLPVYRTARITVNGNAAPAEVARRIGQALSEVGPS